MKIERGTARHVGAPEIIGTLRSTTRQGRRRGLQNVKKKCKLKLLKLRSRGKLTTVFDISSLFYDLQDATVLLKSTLRNSSHLSVSSRRPEDVKMLRVGVVYRTR